MSLKRNGALFALLVLPLAAPVLIFGARATALAIAGEPLAAPLYLLAAIAVLAATLAPWALALRCGRIECARPAGQGNRL